MLAMRVGVASIRGGAGLRRDRQAGFPSAGTLSPATNDADALFSVRVPRTRHSALQIYSEPRTESRARIRTPENFTYQYAYSLNTGSTLPSQGPWNFSSSSSAGVMPRATYSSIGLQIAALVVAAGVQPPTPRKSLLAPARASSSPDRSTSRPAIVAAKPSFGTSSRSFWRSAAVQSLTRSQAASSASSS